MKLSNCGTQPLIISGVTSGAAAFTVPALENACSETLAAGQSCSFAVRYTPTAVQTDSTTLIASNAPEDTQSLGLTGNGVFAPLLQVIAATLTFAPQVPGSVAATQIVTITNVGEGTANRLLLDSSDLATFPETTTCGTVTTGASCTVTIGFTPQAAGSSNAYLDVVDTVDYPLHRRRSRSWATLRLWASAFPLGPRRLSARRSRLVPPPCTPSA